MFQFHRNIIFPNTDFIQQLTQSNNKVNSLCTSIRNIQFGKSDGKIGQTSKQNISKDNKVVTFESFNFKKISSYQIDKMICIQNKYILVISNKQLLIVETEDLKIIPNNININDIEHLVHSLDVEKNICYIIIYHSKKISRYSLDLETGIQTLDMHCLTDVIGLSCLVAGSKANYLAQVTNQRLLSTHWTSKDKRQDVPMFVRRFSKPESNNFTVRMLNLDSESSSQIVYKQIILEIDMVEGNIRFSYQDSEENCTREQVIQNAYLIGFKKMDAFDVSFDQPFISIILHKKFLLLDQESGTVLLDSSEFMETEKIRCITSFSDNDTLYYIHKNNLCSVELNLKDEQIDRLLGDAKFTDVEKLVKVKAYRIGRLNKHRIQEFEFSNQSKLAQACFSPALNKSGNVQLNSLKQFEKIDLNIKQIISIFHIHAQNWITSEKLDKRSISLETFTNIGINQEDLIKNIYSVVKLQYNKILEKLKSPNFGFEDQIGQNLRYSNKYYLNHNHLEDSNIKQSDQILLLEKSLIFLMILMNNPEDNRKMLLSLQKESFKFIKLSYIQANQIFEKCLVVDKFMEVYAAQQAWFFKEFKDSIKIICNCVRNKIDPTGETDSSLRELLMMNMKDLGDFSSKLEVIKSQFGEMVKLAPNILELVVELSFQNSDSLREIITKIQDYDLIRKTKQLKIQLNKFIEYMVSKNCDSRKKQNLDESLLQTKFLIEELNFLISERGKSFECNSEEESMLREKQMVLLKKHQEKVDKSEVLQSLMQTNLQEEQVFLLTVDGKIQEAMTIIRGTKTLQMDINQYIHDYRHQGTLIIWLRNKINDYNQLVATLKSQFATDEQTKGRSPTEIQVEYGYKKTMSDEQKRELESLTEDIKQNVRKCLEMGCDSYEVLKELPEDLEVSELADELTLIYSQKVTEQYQSHIQRKFMDLQCVNKAYNNRRIMDDCKVLESRRKNIENTCVLCQKQLKQDDIWLWYPNNKICHFSCTHLTSGSQLNRDPQSDLEFINFYWI